ncbi:hypothetical protein Efla_007265 [Eimeria flavescens]
MLDLPSVGPLKLLKQITLKTFELKDYLRAVPSLEHPPFQASGSAKYESCFKYMYFLYMSSEDHQAYRQQAPAPLATECPDIYEIDYTSDCWHKRDGIYYLVHWKGYPNPSREPVKNLSGCQHSLEEFHKQVPYDKAVHSLPSRDHHRVSDVSGTKVPTWYRTVYPVSPTPISAMSCHFSYNISLSKPAVLSVRFKHGPQLYGAQSLSRGDPMCGYMSFDPDCEIDDVALSSSCVTRSFATIQPKADDYGLIKGEFRSRKLVGGELRHPGRNRCLESCDLIRS